MNDLAGMIAQETVIHRRHFLTEMTSGDIKSDIMHFDALVKDFSCQSNTYQTKALIDLLTFQTLLVYHVQFNESDKEALDYSYVEDTYNVGI